MRRDEEKGRHKQFPDLLLEMGFFPEKAPLLAYIMDIIDHHGWRNFCADPTTMQPSVVHAFYDCQIDDEEDMIIVHGCEVPFNAREINPIFQLRDNSDAEGNQLVASTSHEHMQDVIRVMAKSGSKWDVSPISIKTLPANCLLPEANLWVYFVKK